MSELPDAARRRLAALERAVADAEALAQSTRSSISALESSRASLVDRRDGAGAAEIAAIDVELETLRGVRDARQARATNDKQVVAQVTGWLVRIRGAVVRTATVRVAADGDLGVIRLDVAARRDELAAVHRAPPSAADIERQAVAVVDALVERGRPAVTISGRRGVDIGWRSRRDAGASGMTAGDTAALLAWLFPDQLRAAVLRETLRRAPPSEGALSADDRGRRIAELEDELLDLERAEEAAVGRSIAAGTDVARRPAADPRALLGVDVLGSSAAERAA